MEKTSLMKVVLCCAMLLTIIQVGQSKDYELCMKDCLERRGCTSPPGFWCELNCEIPCGLIGGDSHQPTKTEGGLNGGPNHLPNQMKPTNN